MRCWKTFRLGLTSGFLSLNLIFAATAKSETPFADLDRALLDDPVKWIDPVGNMLRKLSAEENPRQWVYLVWFLTLSEGTSDLVNEQTLAKALSLSKNMQPGEVWATFKVQKVLNDQFKDEGYAATVRAYEDAINEARQAGNSTGLAYILSALANFHMDNNSLDKAMPLVKEGHDILLATPRASLHLFDQVETSLCMMLNYQGQFENAVSAYEHIVATYRQKNLRYGLIGTLYNLGFSYITDAEDNSKALNPKAIEYLKESLQLSQNLGSPGLAAQSQYGLSVAYTMVGEHAKAIDYARQALKYYESIHSKEWLSPSIFRLARALIAGGSHQEGLEAIDRAEKTFDPVNKQSLNDLRMLRVKALQGLKKYEKALEELLLYVSNLRGIFNEREKKEYARAAADIGLQYQKERNAALAEQVRLQNEQIELLKKFRILTMIIAALLLTLLGFLFQVKRQSREIQDSRRRMKEVLDTIDEGIMVLDRDLKVIPGYSPHLDKLFASQKQSLTGLAIVDLLLAGDRSSQLGIMIQETLRASLGEQILTWELNSDHLPMEMAKGDRILQLHWQPLVQKDNLIHGYLIAIRDITEWKAKERSMRDDAAQMRMMHEKLEEILRNDRDTVGIFVQDLLVKQDSLRLAIFMDQRIKDAFRIIHGWKGNARSLGLKQLAASIHSLESCLDVASETLVDRKAAEEHWGCCQTHIDEYVRLLGDITPQEATKARDFYAYAPIYVKDFKQRLADNGIEYLGLAVEDCVNAWLPDRLPLLHEMIVHALANALDHGFILPAQRGKAVRSAHIVIQAHRSGTRVRMAVEDNGVGIDWQVIRQKSQSMNPCLTSVDAGIHLFTEGLTTASGTTQTSGRGVGMSAIRAICQELGGQLTIEDGHQGGTRLVWDFPWEAVCQRPETLKAAVPA